MGYAFNASRHSVMAWSRRPLAPYNRPRLTVSGAASPCPGYANYERANALFVAKKFSEALAATEEALRLDPKLAPALTLKAKLAMAACRLDVAKRCLEEALAIDPRSAYAQFLYGLEAY